MRDFLQKYIKSIYKIAWLGGSVLLVFLVLIFVLIKIESKTYISSTNKDLPKAQTAIVLGAGLLAPDHLSRIFKDRLDVAAVLYRTGKVETILITGDDGTPIHNEVNPARDYLIQSGIPSASIFLDHAGFDTYSSMYRARDVFLVQSAIIVTQSFHLPRSVFIARRLGMNVYGVPADQHHYRIKNNIREVLANVKAVYDVMYSRRPKYLGKEIPITGDSSDSI